MEPYSGPSPRVIKPSDQSGFPPKQRCVVFDCVHTAVQRRAVERLLFNITGVTRVRPQQGAGITKYVVMWRQGINGEALRAAQTELYCTLKPRLRYCAADIWLMRMDNEPAAVAEFCISNVRYVERPIITNQLLSVIAPLGTAQVWRPQPPRLLAGDFTFALNPYVQMPNIADELSQRLENIGFELGPLTLHLADPGTYWQKRTPYSFIAPN